MALSRDQILQLGTKLEVIEIDIPEWGTDAKVFIRELMAGERDKIEMLGAQLAKNPNAMADFRARIAVMAICDAEGTRLFQDADLQRVSKLGGKALDRIFDAVRKLSGLDDSSVEEAEKN